MRKNNRCKRGHLMTDENTKVRPSTKYVACRQCEREFDKRRRRKLRMHQ